MSAIIRVSHLVKNYGAIKAVEDLSFTVASGEIYGFLGQNGAGKSTTIRMLLGLVTPDAGSIEIFGKELSQHRREILGKVGAVIERPDLYKYLSGEQNLALFARMHGIRLTPRQIEKQMEQVGLADRADSKVKTYSQGMKQRLGLAVALVHNPLLLVLDEPTNGLDPQGIADVRNLILRLSREEGKTILVSSHLLTEIEVMADSMLILDKGRKITEGKVSELFDPMHMQVRCTVRNLEAVAEKIRQSSWATAIKQIKDNNIFFELNQEKIPMLIKDLVMIGAEVNAMQPMHSLEEYFLSLTSANQHVDPFANRTV